MNASSVLTETNSDSRFSALADEHGTPLYIYDLQRLRARVEEMRSAFRAAGCSLFFATMANDRLPLLRLLAGMKVGACVNSMPHLSLARQAGFPKSKIQFTSTGVARADMQTLQGLEIRSNIDSLLQLETWFELGGAEAGIRVNAASLGSGAREDRIGIEVCDLAKAEAKARSVGRNITGLHVYVGTNFQHPDQMLPTLASFFEVAGSMASLSYANIGGGIGVDYGHRGADFDLSVFANSVGKQTNRLRTILGRPIEVIFEPGRSLVANCGTFVTRVTDVKRLRDQGYVGVDGSVAVFPRPLHHPETPHRIRHLTGGNARNGKGYRNTCVVGRTTFSRDILGTASLPRDLRPGDLLAVDDAGAYSCSMASRFLGQPEPYEVFLD
jgi:diaminopimelate decarboxylase